MWPMGVDEALEKYRSYFNEKIKRFGAVPQGVDYNGPEAQAIRFAQLLRIIDGRRPFEIIDFGCGYGALLEFLLRERWKFRYQGYDMLESMVKTASRTHESRKNATFAADAAIPWGRLIAGDLQQQVRCIDAEWRDRALEVLGMMNALCTRAFSFNMLTSYSDADKMAVRPDLYFADPLFYFDHCKRHFGANVALLHDYGLYDFTILVRKQL
jgi:SAM-dependent methyltransferase